MVILLICNNYVYLTDRDAQANTNMTDAIPLVVPINHLFIKIKKK